MQTLICVSFTFRLLKNVNKLHTGSILNKINVSLHNQYVTLKTGNTMSSNKEKLFNGKLDRFQGVTVNSDKEDCTETTFEKKLEGIKVH